MCNCLLLLEFSPFNLHHFNMVGNLGKLPPTCASLGWSTVTRWQPLVCSRLITLPPAFLVGWRLLAGAACMRMGSCSSVMCRLFLQDLQEGRGNLKLRLAGV